MRPRTGLLRLSLFALPLTLAILASAAADESPSRKDIQMVSPALDKYTQNRLLGEVWKRPGLSLRDRSVVTVAALIGRNQTIALSEHLKLALDHGVKPAEFKLLLRAFVITLGLIGPAMAQERILISSDWGKV